MIAWISFVAVFVALGLGVVFIAFRGGPRGRSAGRGGDRGRGGPSRGNRTATALGVTATIVLLGLVVPGLILAGNSREEKGPGGVALNDSDVDGRQVFSRYCAQLPHAEGARTRSARSGRTSTSCARRRSSSLDAIENGRARGQGQMPALLVDGEDAENVANFIVKVAGR